MRNRVFIILFFKVVKEIIIRIGRRSIEEKEKDISAKEKLWEQ